MNMKFFLLLALIIFSAQSYAGSCDQIKGKWKGTWEISPNKGPKIIIDTTVFILVYKPAYSSPNVIMNFIVDGREINLRGDCDDGSLSNRSALPLVSVDGLILGKRITMSGIQEIYDPISKSFEHNNINIKLYKDE